MTRKLLGAIASGALLLGGLAVAAQAPTATATPTVQPVAAQAVQAEGYIDDPYFTGGRYRQKHSICIWQTFTSNNWTPGDLANSWEPAVNTGWRSATQGCADFPRWQVMRIALYRVADGRCTKVTGTTNNASDYIGHPMNQYYNRVWDGNEYPTVWINQYYNDTCWFTYQDRDTRLGRDMSNALGLAPFCSYVSGTQSMANACLVSTRATSLDRNRATILYNPS